MPVDVDSLAIAAISGKIWNVVTPIELYNLANDGVERAIHHKARHIPFRHPQLFLRHCFSLSRFTARLRRRLTARRRWLWLFRAVAPGPKGAQASIWLQRTHQAEQGRCREDETRSHPSRGAECQDSLAGSIFGRPGYGLLSLATRPSPTGSPETASTIGVVVVAVFAASGAVAFPGAGS